MGRSNDLRNANSIGFGLLLNWRQQLTAGTITILCLSLMAVSQGVHSCRRGRSINVDRPFMSPVVELRIDLNRAEWPELTLLPDISETMARRVVEYRKLHGGFTSMDEIKNVKGIGPLTFSKIEPYLLSITPVNATVEHSD